MHANNKKGIKNSKTVSLPEKGFAGKSVQLKKWRNKKLVTKRLKLGRLESTEEFKAKKIPNKKKSAVKEASVNLISLVRLEENKKQAEEEAPELPF